MAIILIQKLRFLFCNFHLYIVWDIFICIAINTKYTLAPQTVHNTPVMNILKGYYYIILF